jgi:hypothetical protein
MAADRPAHRGRMAMALDPQGHFFGLWQSGDTTGVTIYNEPGALVCNDAAVEDVPATELLSRGLRLPLRRAARHGRLRHLRHRR